MAEQLPNGYKEVELVDFGRGLNLRDKVDAVQSNEAIDALNVTFTNRGAVEQRSGFTKFTAAPITNRVDALAPFYKTDGTRQLLVGSSSQVKALSTAGAIAGAAAVGAPSVIPWSWLQFGAPNTEVAYGCNGQNGNMVKWDGAAFSTPTATVNGTGALAMPGPSLLTLMSADNRMVATGFTTTTGGPAGATSSPSHVFFSNPGLPETWETDGLVGRGRNFVQLSPGDGERIMAAVSWRELVFVFKETKFFVFYGNVPQADGTPEFRFRPVDNGQGLASARAITVARDGVYFMSRRGVYKTTGGDPVLVSANVDPIWLGGQSSYFTSLPLNHAVITQCAMAWHEERIYLAYPSGTATTNDRMLVYDTQLQWWSIYDLKASAMTAFRSGNQENLVFGYASGTNDVGQHSPSLLTDDGVRITSLWRSGWSDYGIPAVKTIREALLTGTGQGNFDISHDFQSGGRLQPVVLTAALVWGGGWLWGAGGVGVEAWGPFNQIVPKLARKAARGGLFSVRFSNDPTTSTSWSLNRVILHVREQRNPTAVA